MLGAAPRYHDPLEQGFTAGKPPANQQKGGEERLDKKRVEAICASLSEVSSTLADVAGELADNAIPIGVEAEDRRTDVPEAIRVGAPLAIPESGVVAAAALSDSAAPVARSAPIAATALAAFATAANP